MHITLSVTSELFEARFSWEMVSEIVETPTAWYLLLGKTQAYPLPKELMTEQQQAEFTSFSTWLKSTRATA
ncbi:MULTISPECIES: YcxB family protein [Actinosynnema]|uniref:YcxB family protein n=1 Tax=Actinosynnema TaxID=40566 RepID=UPI0020A3E29D|nr:YcxB family protein [Actinosynnema pretiosum]MCP2096626.1 YcxB-like protein [Actinosynnema pretiosum]